MKLPLFPEDVIDLGNDIFITKTQLREFILLNYPTIAEQYYLYGHFNVQTGLIDRKYAWHSIIEVLNNENFSEEIIKAFYGFRETEE